MAFSQICYFYFYAKSDDFFKLFKMEFSSIGRASDFNPGVVGLILRQCKMPQ